MPWPKGKPHSRKAIEARTATLTRNGKRHKKPDEKGRWRCCSCWRWKDSVEFYKDKRTPSGLRAQCKACHSATSISSRDTETARRNRRRNEATRRARKAGAKGDVSRLSLQSLEKEYGEVCLKCGAKENLQWDHIEPLACGGAHDIGNLQRLCRKCNERKQARAMDYRDDDQKSWVVEFRRIEP